MFVSTPETEISTSGTNLCRVYLKIYSWYDTQNKHTLQESKCGTLLTDLGLVSRERQNIFCHKMRCGANAGPIH